MTREQIMRMLDGFRADMERVMLEPENMSKEPQFENLMPGQLAFRVEYLADLLVSNTVGQNMGNLGAIKRDCLHIANYAMMIHWHAEQRRLKERGAES